jgi:hypothetical protein
VIVAAGVKDKYPFIVANRIGYRGDSNRETGKNFNAPNDTRNG